MLLLIDSVYKSVKGYYPQVLLEEYKYLVKGKEKKRFATEGESKCESEYEYESKKESENKTR